MRLTYHGHLGVTKLVPEVLNSVETNKSSDEETNKLDTTDTTNADTSHEKPEEPLRLKALAALVVELGPAEDSRDSTAKQHGVEENEAADGGVGVIAQDHEGDKPNSRASQLKLSCGKVGQGNTNNAEGGIEGTHESVVDIFGIFLARLELERSIVASKDSRQTHEHLAERGVDVEVVFILDVVASKLSKT